MKAIPLNANEASDTINALTAMSVTLNTVW